MLKVCVVGAGVMGLTSAINIQRTFPLAQVTIKADQFLANTTSFGAGGLFRPNLLLIDGDIETIRRWIIDSWEFFDALAKSERAKESGVTFVPGITVHHNCQDEAYEPIKNLVYDFHTLSEEELRRRNLNYKYGYAFTSVVTQPPVFMHWLYKEFLKSGGKVQKETLNNLEDLSEEFDVVINCCGLNSRKLLEERNTFPVKGQLVHLRAPWIHHFFLSEDDIYFIPHPDKLIVGGTREKGNEDQSADPHIDDRILARAEGIYPSLKGAERIGSWSGLRPFNKPVRVEAEVRNCKSGKKLLVIHNYGHGGNGITLSWGCSRHVVRLLQDFYPNHKSLL